MGRPKLQADEKRQQINFRLTPEDRRRLEAMADADGVSLPVISERLVLGGMAILCHPMMTPELLTIFNDIMDEMQEVQRRNFDKPWYKDLVTWAACKMIFAKGPFARRNPDDWRTNAQIAELWATVTGIQKAKQDAIGLIGTIGLQVSAERFNQAYGRRGLFGRTPNTLLGAVDNRIAEKAAISKIEDAGKRAQIEAIFSVIVQFDEQEEAALQKWHEAVKDYTDAEKEGEALYKSWRREVAQQQMANGEVPSYEDFF